MTRVFITIDWFLPGTNSGGPVRSVANLIAALPECQFYVFTRNTDYCATEAYEGITPNTWVKFSDNCEVYYCSEQNLSKATLTAQLQAIHPMCFTSTAFTPKRFRAGQFQSVRL